jgi:DNA-binding PadR family transcriptional regulator
MGNVTNWSISATEAALLGLLTRGEMSGYDIQRAAETSGGFFWAPAKSRIYAVLPQLVTRGFATSRAVEQESRPTKQLYRITRAGRDALQGWLEEPPTMEPERAPLLLKIYFGELLEPEVLISHVRKLRAEAEALIERLTALDQAPAGASLFGDLTIHHGLEWARAMSRWAAGAEGEIAARLAPAAKPT